MSEDVSDIQLAQFIIIRLVVGIVNAVDKHQVASKWTETRSHLNSCGIWYCKQAEHFRQHQNLDCVRRLLTEINAYIYIYIEYMLAGNDCLFGCISGFCFVIISKYQIFVFFRFWVSRLTIFFSLAWRRLTTQSNTIYCLDSIIQRPQK